MKIFITRLNFKVIVLSLICIILISASIFFIFFNKSKENTNESTTAKVTTSETLTEITTEKVLKDNKGNNYFPSSDLTVYLTFDDGPSKHTPEILSLLNGYNIGATFFVINGKYNSYMKNIVESGSAIALHSYSHKYPEIYASENAFLTDLDKIHNLVLTQTGVDTKIMRFPGGSSNTISRKYSVGIMSKLCSSVENLGYVYFDWNAENGDACGKAVSAERQYKNAIKHKSDANTVVILMHDIDSCGVNLEALTKIIDYYQSIGANFSTITENSPRICHKPNN